MTTLNFKCYAHEKEARFEEFNQGKRDSIYLLKLKKKKISKKLQRKERLFLPKTRNSIRKYETKNLDATHLLRGTVVHTCMKAALEL